MFCLDKLDWKGENLLLYGKNDVMQHRRIDINLIACNASQLTQENSNLTSSECLVDLTSSSAVAQKRLDTMAYLTDRPHISMIYNTQRININEFGDKSIVGESVTTNRQFDVGKPSWVQAWFRSDLLEDETSFINLGFNKIYRNAMSLKMG
jgi:hypothetical protein